MAALFEIPTQEQTRSRIKAAIVSRTSNELRPELPVSQINVFSEVVALAVHDCNRLIQRAAEAMFFSTARGDALTALASSFGVHRKAGTGSSGNVRITVSNTQPYATNNRVATTFRLQDTDGNQYLFSGRVAFAAGENQTTLVGVTSVVVGVDANISAGTVLTPPSSSIARINNINGNVTAATALTAFTGGSGVETDDQLRARLSAVIQNPNAGGSLENWKSWTLEVAGATNAFVISEEAGVVAIYPYFAANENGVPTDANITAVTNHLNSQHRPVTVELSVLKFTPKVVPVTVQIAPFNTANQAAVERAVRGVGVAFGELGGGIELYRLTQAVSTLGLDSANVVTPTANIAGESGKVVVFSPTVESI